MKKSIAVLGLVVILACSVSLELMAVEVSGPGDANCDKHVDAIDASLVLQRSAGLIDTVPCIDAADIDRDGDLTSIDAVLILQCVAGLACFAPPSATAPTSTPSSTPFAPETPAATPTPTRTPEPTLPPTETANPYSPIKAVAADGLILVDQNPFDMRSKTIRFEPKEGGGYQAQVLSGGFREDFGERLSYASTVSGWPATSWEIPLGFAFPFGAEQWSNVFVNLNGNISFGTHEGALWPNRDPWPDGGMRSIAAALDARASAGDEMMISVLWAPYVGGDVYVNASQDSLTVTWDVIRDETVYPIAGRNLFQATLFTSGALEFSYDEVSEHDGVVGFFADLSASGAELLKVDDPPDAPLLVDLQSVAIEDLGSTLVFAMTTADTIPGSVAQGRLSYSLQFEFDDTWCHFIVDVAVEATSWSSCTAAPRLAQFQIDASTVEIMVSKSIFRGETSVLWDASVVWWGGPDDYFDTIGERPLSLPAEGRGEVDMSEGDVNVAGSTFEVFAYPLILRNMWDALPMIYDVFPADDDIVALFTDFRIDDFFNSGSGSFGVSDPVLGIGVAGSRPAGSLENGRLVTSSDMIFVGGRRFDESGFNFHSYATGIHWMVHEAVHRWAAHLSFRNPITGNVESLTDDWCDCHWNDGLHAPAFVQVADHFTDDPYEQHSIMGGNVWQENPDGTFSLSGPTWQPISGLSALDLYVMGLLAPEDVPDTFILRDMIELGDGRVSATKHTVTIEDIIDAMGSRVPPSHESQREFALGVYLVHESDRPPIAELVARAQGIANNVAQYYELASGGRMSVSIE